MSRLFSLAACLLLLLSLAGCASPTGTAGAVPAGLTVQARLQLPAYRLQGLLSAYTAADIAEVRLSLLRRVAGSYQPTGARFTLAPAALGEPISLGQLKLGSAYRLIAEAYGADATLISDPANSATDFETPGIATVAGVDTIDLTPVSVVPVRLTLIDRVYAGSGSFVVTLSKALLKKTVSVRVTLLAGGTPVHEQTYPVEEVLLEAPVPLRNLRLATAYTLQAEALDATGAVLSNSRNSIVDLTTPDPASGPVDDMIGSAPLALPCK